jgi:SagB-type dehydrogenase family enzyme
VRRKLTPRLRRARSLIAYWQNDRLFFLNFARRSTASARPQACEILDFFTRWRTQDEAISRFPEYSKRSVRSAVAQLKNHGLLLTEGSADAVRDEKITRDWKAWLPEGGFHFATKNAAYVRTQTRDRWLKSILPKTPAPNPFKALTGTEKIRLSLLAPSDSEFIHVLKARRTYREFSTRPLPVEVLSQLLSLVWGVTGYVHSPIFGKLPLKTSPSGGSRHPGEVYVAALRVRGLRSGLYHYHPARHQLELIQNGVSRSRVWRYCAHQDYVKDAAALFIMTAMFKRTMWKYNHARAYRVVLLDAGHLCQTFYLVATWLGLAPFSTAALDDTLIENDLKIDGISESVLYVAGVGLHQTPNKAESRIASTRSYVKSRKLSRSGSDL